MRSSDGATLLVCNRDDPLPRQLVSAESPLEIVGKERLRENVVPAAFERHRHVHGQDVALHDRADIHVRYAGAVRIDDL